MPLADELRPKTLEDFVGQDHLLSKGKPLRVLIESQEIPSMVFWGPPASGKTTLARIISTQTNAEFLELSAVNSGKADLKNVIEMAKKNHQYNRKTILFIDEIHRWNKAQQDGLLPYTESGEIILIGATTENPSFSIISPLLSRSRVFTFTAHTEENIKKLIKIGVKKLKLKIKNAAINYLASVANGDPRFALNTLEIANSIASSQKIKIITSDTIADVAQKWLRYDKTGEEHYNTISAVHKGLRSSNATAAIYWIMRMLHAGEDPLYIARRLIRFASEDIGNANPNAVLLANVVYDVCHRIGMPEAETALAQLAEYLANSKKNNKAYVAVARAKEDIDKYGNLPVPLHLRNAPTKFMKESGYGDGYKYDHDLPTKKSKQQLLPDKIKDRDYFVY